MRSYTCRQTGYAGSYVCAAAGKMTLFLKKIDPDFLKDQGPDLKKVLAFKERIHSEHLILYKEFALLEEFEESSAPGSPVTFSN
jgi:hypothetical protein